MIDFRYHIVSLISVFLALAVGIALGAGPLKETVGDTLTGQVEQLREDRDGLRTALEEAQRSEAAQRSYLEAAAPQLVEGTLQGRRVAVVMLGPLEADVLSGVVGQLESAGASVSARVTVTEGWTDPSLRSFRQALSGNLATYLDPQPSEQAGVEVDLAEALAQGLTGADPAAPNELSEQASLLLQLLASDESELITVEDAISAPADAIVVLAATADTERSETPAPVEDVVAAHVAIASAAQARSDGAVVAGGARTPGGLVETILGDGDLADSLSTVSRVDQLTGQVSVPLALNARIAGPAGHFGVGDGETPVPVPSTLPPVDRTPTLPPVEPAAAQVGPTDPADDEAAG
ncbi:copper transporter [Cellulomonas fimi]|uniref:Copper transporter n=1 Tax=Cellulomonas fimi TaxID=1708 RepID=A0A7Y0QIZ9_CELFI|nr:copper transporter [Cellulomonas fimi]NMR21419.1 copper transporter [Cellulomonas fimi]